MNIWCYWVLNSSQDTEISVLVDAKQRLGQITGYSRVDKLV